MQSSEYTMQWAKEIAEEFIDKLPIQRANQVRELNYIIAEAFEEGYREAKEKMYKSI